MMAPYSKISSMDTGTEVVLVLDKEIRRRRRIEFLIRMAGCDPYGVENELEAVNWLRTIPAMKPAALLILPSLDLRARETLYTTASGQMQIPVIGVTPADSSERGLSGFCTGDTVDFTTSEELLITTLRNVCSGNFPGSSPDATLTKEQGERMSVTGNRSSKPTTRLHLSGVVGRQTVEQLSPAIVTALKLGGEIVIDGREIKAIDHEGISALCGLHRDVARRGRTLRIEGFTPGLLDEAVAGNQGAVPWEVCSIKENSPCLWTRD
jgi:ABC-type transporter Mla MlaB component